MCMHFGWGNGRSEFKMTISYTGAACFMGPITSNGGEATVTERAARFNSDTASCDTEGDRCEPKGLIHPLVDRI